MNQPDRKTAPGETLDLFKGGYLSIAETIAALEGTFEPALKSRVEELTRERDEARLLVTEANNSLYGSQGYFHSLNGGPFDKYHLANGIENLKAICRRASAISLEDRK